MWFICKSFKSTVVLRVVSLAGIRAVASTHITERGAQVWVRVSGLDENESPFSFGGALHPFKVTWTVSHPGVLQVIHPFGSSISETDDNRFAVWLEGCNPGSATVKVLSLIFPACAPTLISPLPASLVIGADVSLTKAVKLTVARLAKNEGTFS
ncbi:hypothetical protein ANCCAN_09793 [Ancylostoma caninum]|uniref:NUP210 Ig-like domain-containing protein n=1 Tax=Ancylostoma caninum TaxID=29170 RepID=A0A368GMD8_ANCCA|nr:hypothetical protein ANCCAN_09793 [Ancylostoma caninum]